MEKENLEGFIKLLMELPDEELIKEMDAIIIALKKFIDSDEPTPEQKEILNAFITNPGWYHNPDWDELDKLFEEELWKIKDLKQKNILTMYEIY